MLGRSEFEARVRYQVDRFLDPDQEEDTIIIVAEGEPEVYVQFVHEQDGSIYGEACGRVYCNWPTGDLSLEHRLGEHGWGVEPEAAGNHPQSWPEGLSVEALLDCVWNTITAAYQGGPWQCEAIRAELFVGS